MNFLLELLPGLLLTFITTSCVVWFAYYVSNPHNREYIVTFMSFSILLYFVLSLLRDVQISIGIGFGLLAVFSLINYRSNNIPIKEMTYLFICITIPFLNALYVVTDFTFIELVLLNVLVFVMIWVLERLWGVPYQPNKRVLYERIDLIQSENQAALLADLRLRTGLNVLYTQIEEIDFLHDTAILLVFYEPSKDEKLVKTKRAKS